MKAFKYLSTGLSIGFVCTTFFSMLWIGANEMTLQILGWCIASALYGLSSMLFEVRRMQSALGFVLHYFFCACITGVMIFLFYRPYTLSVLLSFTVSYAVIAFVIWQAERAQLRKLNERLSAQNRQKD